MSCDHGAAHPLSVDPAPALGLRLGGAPARARAGADVRARVRRVWTLRRGRSDGEGVRRSTRKPKKSGTASERNANGRRSLGKGVGSAVMSVPQTSQGNTQKKRVLDTRARRDQVAIVMGMPERVSIGSRGGALVLERTMTKIAELDTESHNPLIVVVTPSLKGARISNMIVTT